MGLGKVEEKKDGGESLSLQKEERTETPEQKNPIGDLILFFSNLTHPYREVVWPREGPV